MNRRRAWGIGLVSLVSAVAFLFPVAARADTVIDFDAHPPGTPPSPGTPITNQYHAQGVDFATPVNGFGAGIVPVVTAVPAGEAASGDQVADISCIPYGSPSCSSALAQANATFTRLHGSLSVAVGRFDDSAMGGDVVALIAYGSDGAVVAQSGALPITGATAGFHNIFRVATATPQIASFSLRDGGAVSFGFEGRDHLGIDDVTYDDTHTVTVGVQGSGTVSGAEARIGCPGACFATYAAGASVVLTAKPNAGSVFAGWSGACTDSSTTCTVALDADRSVAALFLAGSRLTVSLAGAGTGTVGSAPDGIVCGSSCAAVFTGGQVTLTATAAQGSSFSNWGGDCAGVRLTCTLTMAAAKSVTANFTLTPAIADLGKPRPPDVLPKPFTSVAVDVAGNGSVTSSLVGPGSGSQALRAAATIRCGLAGFLCYAKTGTSGARLILHAQAGPGQVFKGWSGACSGTSLTCLAAYGKGRTVSASFVSRNGVSVSTALAPPRFHVGWAASVGSGALLVSGRVSRPSALRIELRRPFGAPLLTEEIAVAAGHFARSIKLLPGVLSRGARLFPGPFVVLLQGHSGSSALPRALQTVVLPAPGRGVVRTHFARASEKGSPTSSVPAAAGKAFAHFQFQSQPRAGLVVTVSWFLPNGRLLGTIRKANRAVVESSITSSAPLPVGAWRADLRVGGKLVSSLRVRLV